MRRHLARPNRRRPGPSGQIEHENADTLTLRAASGRRSANRHSHRPTSKPAASPPPRICPPARSTSSRREEVLDSAGVPAPAARRASKGESVAAPTTRLSVCLRGTRGDQADAIPEVHGLLWGTPGLELLVLAVHRQQVVAATLRPGTFPTRLTGPPGTVDNARASFLVAHSPSLAEDSRNGHRSLASYQLRRPDLSAAHLLGRRVASHQEVMIPMRDGVKLGHEHLPARRRRSLPGRPLAHARTTKAPPRSANAASRRTPARLCPRRARLPRPLRQRR